MKNKLIILLAALSILTMVTLTADPADNSSTIVVEVADVDFQFALEEQESTNGGAWVDASNREILQAYEDVRNGFSANFRIRSTAGSYSDPANLKITVTTGPLTLEASGATFVTPSISGSIGSAFSGTFSNGIFNLAVTTNYLYGLAINSDAESLPLTFGFASVPNAPSGKYICEVNVEYEFV